MVAVVALLVQTTELLGIIQELEGAVVQEALTLVVVVVLLLLLVTIQHWGQWR